VFTRSQKILTLALVAGLTASVSFAQSRDKSGNNLNQATAKKSQRIFPKLRMVAPQSGEALVPGQKVTIAWETDIPAALDLKFCEQEIFLSLDGGKTLAKRITPRLNGTATAFTWTVPDLPTSNAVLVFRFGSEGGKHIFEKAYIKKESRFRIENATGLVEKVEFQNLTLNQPVKPGQEMQLNWQSNISDVQFYEVAVSYDLGANFHVLGKTSTASYNWQVPTTAFGNVTFQVTAQKADGSRVSSLIDAEPQLRVQRDLQ
jgi:hypothetical protein